MKTAARILIVIISAAFLGVPLPHDSFGATATPEPIVRAVASAGEPVQDPPGIYGADAEFTAVINTAIERFNSTGLTLEPLRVYVHSSDEVCNGAKGLFSTNGELDRIDLCSGRTLFIVLHELAHAWAHHNMTESNRRAFLDHTGLTWDDRGIDWRNRGTEVVASTIAWGLLDTPLTATDAGNYAELLHRFELLTGMPSPRAT